MNNGQHGGGAGGAGGGGGGGGGDGDGAQRGGGGQRHQQMVSRLKHPHPRFGEARAKANTLETTIEKAQKEYAAQLSKIIRKLQRQFYTKFGDKIQELEDLEEAIGNIQYSGMKNLKRQLTRLYLEGDEGDQHGGGMRKEQMQHTAKQLYAQYKEQYFPNDDYQRKRNAEASKLQMAIMGSLGGALGGQAGGGGSRAYVVPHGSAALNRGAALGGGLGLVGYGHDDDALEEDDDGGAGGDSLDMM